MLFGLLSLGADHMRGSWGKVFRHCHHVLAPPTRHLFSVHCCCVSIVLVVCLLSFCLGKMGRVFMETLWVFCELQIFAYSKLTTVVPQVTVGPG